jgi:hypothetical protein
MPASHLLLQLTLFFRKYLKKESVSVKVPATLKASRS